jgi:hypothetical protein
MLRKFEQELTDKDREEVQPDVKVNLCPAPEGMEEKLCPVPLGRQKRQRGRNTQSVYHEIGNRT